MKESRKPYTRILEHIMELKVIRDEDAYEAALLEVEHLMEVNPPLGSPEGDRLDLLAFLLEKYDEEHNSIALPDPVTAIQVRMTDLTISQRQLSQRTGIAESKVSEMLNRKRPLNLPMIRRLSSILRLPSDVLVQEYELA